MIQRIFFYFSFLAIILNSCTNSRLDVDVSNYSLPIVFVNLDSILVSSNKNNIPKIFDKYSNTSDGVLAYQLVHCLGIGGYKDSSSLQRIELFRNDPYVKRLESEIATQFKSKDLYEIQIIDGFKHLNYHLPNFNNPVAIYYINSLFVSNVYCSKSEVGIGLDRYLGANSNVIRELPTQEFFQWMKEGMKKEFIPRDVVSEWIATNIVKDVDGTFAEKMIRWGKILYLTEAAFPEMDKNVLFRYTKNGYDWAEHNESSIWKYIVNQELLFSKNERDHANFLHEGPFTVGLPEKSPDRLGQYLGWKIVHDFMEKNENISLKRLINLSYNTILQSYELKE
jgi:hypothetical protein